MKSRFALRGSRVQHEIVSLLVLARRVGQLRPLENCDQPGVSGGLHRAADGDDFASGILQLNRHRRFQDRVMDAGFVILLQMRGHDISERDLAAWAEHPLKAEGIEQPLQTGGLALRVVRPQHIKARGERDVRTEWPRAGFSPEPEVPDTERHNRRSIRITFSTAASVARGLITSRKVLSSVMTDSAEDMRSSVLRPSSVSFRDLPCSSVIRPAAVANAMARFSHGSTRTTRSAGLRSPVNTRLTSSRESLVRAEWAMKCSFCKLARLPRLRPRMRMISAIPQAMRRSPGTGSGLDVSSNGPSSNVPRKSGGMVVWRKIERAAKQPLRDRSQSDLLSASVGEVRDVLLHLGDQRVDLGSEDMVWCRAFGAAVKGQFCRVPRDDRCERFMKLRRFPAQRVKRVLFLQKQANHLLYSTVQLRRIAGADPLDQFPRQSSYQGVGRPGP